jgi:hypothetical protein
MVIQKDHSPTKQLGNSSFLSTIKALFSKLQQPVTTKWINSHYEGNTPGKPNSDAQLKDEAKDLATQADGIPALINFQFHLINCIHDS